MSRLTWNTTGTRAKIAGRRVVERKRKSGGSLVHDEEDYNRGFSIIKENLY